MSSVQLVPGGRLVRSVGAVPTLRVSLLGPVEVSTQGVDVALSPLELNLLVLLALSPGVTVSTERLIDDLWGSQLPSAPRSRLQGIVSGLRRKVGDVVLTRCPGYLVDGGRIERDLDECDRLAGQARAAGDLVERVRLYAAAQGVWRGEPLTGVSTAGVLPERARLDESRWQLLEARCEAELAVGNHRWVTGVLAPAVAENPFREQLACLYITALYRSNRQADAFAVYHELRERLADELGSDVCPDLRELYAQILRGDELPAQAGPDDLAPAAGLVDPPVGRVGPAASVTTPAQLPARDALFLGRDAELGGLAGGDPGGGGAVTVVSGPGGLGKTALVVEWAHRLEGEFPDGLLYLDLGVGEERPEDAVGSVLLALGVAGADVPARPADRLGLYRTMIRGRRLLVVADNAQSAEQVLGLVPPGRSSRLVVTSRHRLVPLGAHHAWREVVLAPLSRDASYALLRVLVGEERLAGTGTSALLGWCGGWPLLLRHVGALLAFRPSQPVATFAAELEAGALDGELSGDPRSVDAALAHAHASLTPAAAALFERLALHGGACCLRLATVAAGTTASRTRRLLDELSGIHFLVEHASGEFRYHDVVARFGRRLAGEQEWVTPEPCTTDPLGCHSCEGLLATTIVRSQQAMPTPR